MPLLLQVKCLDLFLLLILGSLLKCSDSQQAETENSGEGILTSLFSPKWPSWENGPGSIVLPILSQPDTTKDPEKRSAEDEEPSIFSRAASALSNFADAGIKQMKNRTLVHGINTYVQNLTEQYNIPGQDAVKVVGNTLDTFHDVAFPTENTSFIDGFSNVVKEVQATNEQLGGVEQIQRLATGIGDKAKELVGLGGAVTTERAMELEETRERSMELTTPEPTLLEGTTLIICIAAVAVVSLLINAVLLCCLCKHQKNLKTVQEELQTYSLEKDNNFREQLNTLLKQDVC